MKEKMLEDLTGNGKEEYMSEAGIALLLDRSGGKLTGNMVRVMQRAVVTRTITHQRCSLYVERMGY